MSARPASVPVPTGPAPTLEVDLVGGGRFVLSAAAPERFTLVVFYRGWHCPICRGYLAQLDRAADELARLGVEVVAVSGDDEARARRSVTEWGLARLRVGYGQSVDSMREWGLFVSRGVKEPEPELFGEPGGVLGACRWDDLHGGAQLHASGASSRRRPGRGDPVLRRAGLPGER